MHVKELIVPDRLAIAITSVVQTSGRIYLGLTGGPRLLAWLDPDDEAIVVGPEVAPWIGHRGYCGKIHNALAALNDGSLLYGECSHLTWDGLPVTAEYFDTELPERMLARKRASGFPDVVYGDFCRRDLVGWSRLRDDPGGRIMQFDTASQVATPIAALPPTLYVQSLCVDAARSRAFGHTLPDNHFFSLEIATGKLTDHGRISEFAFHNLFVDSAGVCHGGWIDASSGALKHFRFDPAVGAPEWRDTVLLRDPGAKIAGNRGIDQWLATRSGRVFMGTVANSLLFEFDPSTGETDLLCRLAKGGRVTSMDEDTDGALWITADYPNSRLLRYDPSVSGRAALQDFGPVQTRYERCYFHGSCLHNRRLYLAETDGFSPSLHVIDLASL